MSTERLSELFPLRLTPSLKRALEREARALGMRPVDIARMALSKAVAHWIEPMGVDVLDSSMAETANH